MKRSLSIEIFKDVDFPDIDVNTAHEGIDQVNEFVRILEVVKDTRKLRLGRDITQPLVTNIIKWPQIDTDLAILLTGRDLHTNQVNAIGLGSTHRIHSGAKALTVIDALKPAVASTTAHETGHMLGLQYHDQHDTYHCQDGDCIMSNELTHSTQIQRIQKKGIRKVLERYGMKPAEYQEITVEHQSEFCLTCREQLAKRAFFLLQHKQGKFVPENWR